MDEVKKKKLEEMKRKYEAETKESKEYERLLSLDKKVENALLIPTLSLGILGSLVLGGGMSLIMSYDKMNFGIIIGCLGLLILGISYPVGSFSRKRKRKQLEKEINSLCHELATH